MARIEQLVCDGCGKAETKRREVFGWELVPTGGGDAVYGYEAHEDPACHRRYFSAEAKAATEAKKEAAAKK